MSSISTTSQTDKCILSLTTSIVASYAGKNKMAKEELSGLIRCVYRSLVDISHDKAPEQPPLEPAVPIERSVQDEYIVCLEDGKRLKMLKRYLRTRFNLTPEQYRQKWGLPADYPMVAPDYSRRRSAFAKELGLGRGIGVRQSKPE